MFQHILDVVFPKRCVGCRSIGSYLCGNCFDTLIPNDSPLCLACDKPAIGGVVHPGCKTRYTPEGVTAIFQFEPTIKALIHEMKYRGVTDIVPLASQFLIAGLPENLPERIVVVPVPLYKTKKRERGFNQSELLAEEVARALRMPLGRRVLERTINTPSQTKLDREERKENMRNAFVCGRQLKGVNILLIDDTVTTGATMTSCANILKRSGARSVWCLALAQARI